MSKELYFTDGNNEVKYLDTTASFNLAITQDGSAFDLTNAKTIDVKVANDTGYVFDKPIDMATIKQPLAGLITMPVDAEVMNALVPDDYTIEVWVTLSSLVTPGSQEGLTDGPTISTATSSTGTTTYNAIFPSDDPQGFTITENVMSDSGDVIPVMSLDDFQQEFDQLKTDLTNKVSTLKGPKGDTGQGLEIKGKVDTTSQLPATASEGDGYLVGEELYVWTNSAWKDCGPIQGPQGVQGIQGKTGTGISSTTIQYQISSSATTAPTVTWSDNIIATTTANPNLWMKATLNYTDGTTKDFYLVSQKGDKGDKGDTGDTGPIGAPGPVGAGLVVKGTVNNASQLPTTGNQEGYCYFVGTDLYVWDAGAWKNCGNVSPDLSKYVTVTDLNNGLSTKVTDNGNGTIQVNGSSVSPYNKLSDTIGGRNLLTGTGNNTVTGSTTKGYLSNETTDDLLTLFKGLEGQTLTVSVDYKYSGFVAGSGTSRLGWETQINAGTAAYFGAWYSPDYYPNDSGSGRISKTFVVPKNITSVGGSRGNIQFSGSGTGTLSHLKLEKGSVATDWSPAPEDKADDSKVAHLSGANNFDTVPTVNNNPLLLASSLPSDLARTGQDQEFTGKNTFDVAPIDKTTGNPYITKDGVPAVPSTLADTTKLSNFTAGLQSNGTAVATTSDVTTAISTATANMVDSTKATNFTAGLQSGGVDVATAADLKSIEDSAWYQLDNKYIIPSKYTLSPATNILYKIDDSNHKIYLSGSIALTNSSYTDKVPVTIQLDSIVKSILTVLVPYFGDDYNGGYIKPAFATASPKSLTINAILGLSSIAEIAGTQGSLAYVTYDELV